MVLESRDIFSSAPDVRRTTIRNLYQSYAFPFDLLAELVQNSVDAIRAHIREHGSTRSHAIRVELDQTSRTVKVVDTGTGISPAALHLLIGPHVGTKLGDADAIGEKGVGMTFAAFSCNDFVVDSQSLDGRILASMAGNSSWLAGNSESDPTLQVLEIDSDQRPPDMTGTAITLSGVAKRDDLDHDLFHLTLPSLVWILRTQTAIGNTRSLFGGESEDVTVTAVWRDSSGEESTTVPFGFCSVTELISKKDVVDLKDFIDSAASYSDEQKRAKLRDKVLIYRDAIERSNRTINFVAIRVPTRTTWEEIAEKNKLYLTDDDGKKHELLSPGIFVATKGMPTAVQLDPPNTGYSGDWPTIHILIEDVITFDLGRKTVPPRTAGMLRDICKAYFNTLMKFRRYMSDEGDGPDVIPGPIAYLNKQREFEAINQLSDLGLDQIRYQKHPNGQEAAVVAIFHELVGEGTLGAFHMQRTGYRQRYDSWGSYLHPSQGHVPVVAEFKFNAESILADVQERRKYFEELDLIICWDLHEEAFAREQVTVSYPRIDERVFREAQFLLHWPSIANLGLAGTKPVLALKVLIDKLRNPVDPENQ